MEGSFATVCQPSSFPADEMGGWCVVVAGFVCGCSNIHRAAWLVGCLDFGDWSRRVDVDPDCEQRLHSCHPGPPIHPIWDDDVAYRSDNPLDNRSFGRRDYVATDSGSPGKRAADAHKRIADRVTDSAHRKSGRALG